MAPEQRNNQFSSDTDVTAIVAPWRVRANDRDELLRWFLEADLTSEASVARLLERTGRDFGGLCVWTLPNGTVRFWAPPGHAQDLREVRRRAASYEKRGQPVEILDSAMIPRGNEGPNASWALLEPASRSDFIAFYDRIRGYLREAERWFAEWEKGAPAAQARINVKLSTLLDDVRVDAALAPDEIALERPMRPDLRSVSLAGELALAMFQRMVRAREVVVCPSCGEIEIFPDMRHREICSKPECRAWYRAKWMRQKYAAEKARTANQRKAEAKKAAKITKARKGARKAVKK